MKNTLKSLAVVAVLAVSSAACNVTFVPSQTDLANEVVTALNNDAYNYGGYTYSLQKAISASAGYSVLYNNQTGRYLAIYVVDYNGQSGQNYLNAEADAGGVYYNLYNNGDGTFTDLGTGYLFEKVEVSAKNINQLKAQLQTAKVNSMTATLAKKTNASGSPLFATSEAAANAAKVVVAYSDKISNHEADSAAADAAYKSVTGSTYSQIVNVAKSNDPAQINAALKAANDSGLQVQSADEAEAAIKSLIN